MRNSLSSAVSCLVIAAVLFPLSGCIAHAPGSGGGGTTGTTTVTVTPTSATVMGGSTTNFTATVTGPQLTAVTWYVNGILNGNSTLGTLTAGSGSSGTTTAVYTAPVTVPSPATVSVTAQAVADGTNSAASTVTITKSTVAVTITPNTANVDAGATQTFTATVTGTTNTAVAWYVDTTILNGSSTVGTIAATSTSTGSTAVYTAPIPAPSNTAAPTITAVSVANTGASATANVTVPPIVVTLTPASTVPIPVSGTQTFTAAVTGASDTAVTNWQVNSIPGGNSTFGTIVSTGSNTALYTAPSSVTTAPFPVTISAASAAPAAGSTSVGQVQANVHVVVNITPAVDSIGQGANLQYTATVNGAPSTSQSVTWSQPSCPACASNQSAGSFDSNNNPGLYLAPGLTAGVTSAAVTITATPDFDQTQPGTATTTVQQTDPLGMVSDVQTMSSCPADSKGGLANGTCYSMNVSCDGIADLPTYLKVNPADNAVGTVLFLIGTGGSGFYDNNPAWLYGYETVEQVFAANFNTVQVSFGAPFDNGTQPNGWLQGPGGVRRLACRFATVANWVYNNPKTINPNSSAATSAPMCATGNSDGSGAVAYAAFQYGLAGQATTGPTQEFTMIEPTSGPLMTRLDLGCVCNGENVNGPQGTCTSDTAPEPMCFSSSEASIIDPAYQVQNQPNQPTLCSDGLTGTATNFNRFASDSIDWDPFNPQPIVLSKSLIVTMEFGGDDTSTDVPQGMYWWSAVRPVPPTPLCQAKDATGEIPNAQDGAGFIATDIINSCKLPPAKPDQKTKPAGTLRAPSSER